MFKKFIDECFYKFIPFLSQYYFIEASDVTDVYLNRFFLKAPTLTDLIIERNESSFDFYKLHQRLKQSLKATVTIQNQLKIYEFAKKVKSY